MGRLDGRIAVITGAAGLIGATVARLFVSEGAAVTLVDRDEAPLRQVAQALGDRATIAVARYGGVDVLLLNAGIEGVVRPIPEYPLETFDQVMRVNVRGVLLGLQHGMPLLQARGGGSVVITSSIAGPHGFAGAAAYVTSKHAVIGLMRVAALEGAPHGIRVNTVNPAPIEGRMIESLEEGLSPGAPDQARAGMLGMISAGRYGVADEVARLMLFLASDDSRYCTGGVYPVDGGMSAI